MDLKKFCLLSYGIFAATVPLQFSVAGSLLAVLAITVDIILLYQKKKAAEGTPWATHIAWLLRTFWIGTGVYLPVAMLAGFFALLRVIDFGALADQMSAAGPDQMQAMLMTQYGGAMKTIFFTTFVPVNIWWLWRCWRGYRFLQADKPVEKVTSWL